MTLTKTPQTEATPRATEPTAPNGNEAAYKEEILESLLAEFGSAAPQKAAAEPLPRPAPEAPADAEAAEEPRAAEHPSLVVDGVDFSEFLYDSAPAQKRDENATAVSPAPVQTAEPEEADESAPRAKIVRRRISPGSLVLRLFAFAAVLATVVFLYTQTVQTRVSSAEFDEVSAAVLSALSLDEMQQADAQMVRRLYGFTPSEMDGCTLYYPATNMGAQEVLVVKLADLSQQKTVSDAINARRQTQMASFEGYGIEQYALLERAVIEVQGNYLLFVVHPDAASARQAFLKAL